MKKGFGFELLRLIELLKLKKLFVFISVCVEGLGKSLYTCWMNCKKLTNNFSFRITHIYHEDNACADKLASYGAQSFRYT